MIALDQLDAALAGFGLQRTGAVAPLAAGTLNRNYVVTTPSGKQVLRSIRPDQPALAIAAEHAAIAWAGARDIPVAQPLRRRIDAQLARAGGELPDSCVVLADGSRWAAFPFIVGRLPVRGAVTERQVAALGDMHGRLHAVLAIHPQSSGARFAMRWDRAGSCAVLAAAENAARAARAEPQVIAAIALQHDLLEREPVRDPADFAHLPCQMLHGDYHDAQVLLDDGDRVAAVLDWELFQAGARIWELIRALAFMDLLEHELLATYLSAYVCHVRLTPAECAAGMALWWQSRLGGAWVWSAYFLQCNTRVETLFDSTIATLHKLAQPGWRTAVTQRFCAAVAVAQA